MQLTRGVMVAGTWVLMTGCGDPTKPRDVEEEKPDTVTATLPWLKKHSHVITRLEGAGADADLVAFGDMIATARVVGMGEATHGTRESSLFKIRVFKYLAANRGFTSFGIEASMPEAFAIDDYVRGGPGNARELVRDLYFWTVGGEDMVEFVEWLRVFNQSRTPASKVGFHGFDIQFPGRAIDSVIAYAGRAGGDSVRGQVEALYSCAQPYRNDENGMFSAWYDELPTETRASCNQNLEGVRAALLQRATKLIEMTSSAQFARALQLARVVEQWAELVHVAAAGDRAAAYQQRDEFMTENIMWALESGPPNGRTTVWAHNGHVANYNPGTPTRPITMGHFLKNELGRAGYVTLGFALDSGSFTARHAETSVLGAYELPPATAQIDAYEHILRQVAPMYYVDLRAPVAGTEIANWLAGPRRLRQVGALYHPTYWNQYFAPHELSKDFDLLAFVARSTPARLLAPGAQAFRRTGSRLMPELVH